MIESRWSAEDLELARQLDERYRALGAVKPVAIEAFKAIIAEYPTGVNLEQVYADAEAIEDEYAQGLAFSGIAPLVFRYCGRNVLSKVVVPLKTTHIRIDDGQQGITAASDGFLSTTVEGVPTGVIVQTIAGACLARYHAGPGLTRAERSKALCGIVSSEAATRLSQELPVLASIIRRIELPEHASRPVQPTSEAGPRVRGLGMNHNILALELGKRIVVIDPTIAQVDQPDYDIEVNDLPKGCLTDFVQLRYGMLPEDTPSVYTLHGTV